MHRVIDALHALDEFLMRHRELLRRFVPLRGRVLVPLDGFRLYVDLDDWDVGLRIALRRIHEPHVTRTLSSLIRPGMVVADIGANVGYYTLLAASRVGSEGRVIAFEPGEPNRELIRSSLAKNGFRNVSLHPYAVAEAVGMVGYHMADSNGAIGDNGATCSVPAVALDSFLADEPRIDIIKQDIEGAEGRALAGMSRLLERHRPLLFTEFAPSGLPERSGLEPEAFLARLRALGYTLSIVDGSPSPRPRSDDEIMAIFEARPILHHLDLLARPEVSGSFPAAPAVARDSRRRTANDLFSDDA